MSTKKQKSKQQYKQTQRVVRVQYTKVLMRVNFAKVWAAIVIRIYEGRKILHICRLSHVEIYVETLNPVFLIFTLDLTLILTYNPNLT
jgi:hypothetical protein